MRMQSLKHSELVPKGEDFAHERVGLHDGQHWPPVDEAGKYGECQRVALVARRGFA